MNDARQLVILLRHGGLRSRVGTILLPHTILGREETLAAQLDVHYINFASCILDSLPEEAAYLTLSVDKLTYHLDLLANSRTARDCILLANFDLPLSRLAHENRLLLWGRLLLDFPYKKNSLILLLPAVVPHSALLPEGGLQQEWADSKRLVNLSNGNLSEI
ncbi:MAG: hypothetical protein WCT12_31245 [Verrucomicrobiota bacterium]